MADEQKEATEQEPVVSESTPAGKMAPVRKTSAKNKAAAGKISSTDENRRAADSSRKALINRLKIDLMKARDAAREELKLANVAARDEIAVLKDQLAAALKREEKLRKLSEKKIKKMLAAGERWEKKQRVKLKKAADRARKKLKK